MLSSEKIEMLKGASFYCEIKDYSNNNDKIKSNLTYNDVKQLIIDFNKNYNGVVAGLYIHVTSKTEYSIPTLIYSSMTSLKNSVFVMNDEKKPDVFKSRISLLAYDMEANTEILRIFFND